MKCPYCKTDNNKVYAHAGQGDKSVWAELVRRYNTESITRRYRVCLNCGKRFATVEVYKEEEYLERFFDESYTNKDVVDYILRSWGKRLQEVKA